MNMQNSPWKCCYSIFIAVVVMLVIIVNVQETTLAANQPLRGKRSNGENQSKSQRETEKQEEPENQLDQPEFYSNDQQINQINETVKEIVAPQISLEPLQIRTFIATVSWY